MASLIRDGVVDSQWHRWHRPRVRALFPHEAAAAVPALPGARGHPGYVLLEWSLTLFVRYLPLDVSKQASTPTDSLTLSLSLFFSLSLSSFFHCISCPPPRMHACMQTCIHISDFSILTNTLDTIQFLPSIPHQLMHRPMHQKVCMRIWDSYLLLGEAFFVRAAVS